MKKNKIEVFLLANTTKFVGSFATASKGIRAFNKQISASQKAARGLDQGLSSMAGKFGALFGGISLTLFTQSIWESNTAMQGLENSFKAIAGSSEAAASEIDFVREASDKLGLNFQTTIEAYKGISAAAKGTSLAGKTTREVFLGISEASTTLGLSADQSAGALLAISQMISKGKVSAEELRGQLGERLPGAFQIAADAMGVTTGELDKMMSTGNLMTEDFLPKFAKAMRDRFARSAVDASASAVAAMNRFQNSWFELKINIGKSGFLDLATGKIVKLTEALKDPAVQAKIIDLSTRFFELADAVLTFTFNHAEAIAKVLGGLVALSALSRSIYLIIGAWQGLNAAMVIATGSRIIPWLGGLAVEMGVATIAAMGLAGAIGLVAGATGAYLVGYSLGGKIAEWEYLRDITNANKDALAEVPDKLAAISKATGLTIKSFADLDRAGEAGLIHFDAMAGGWVKSAAKMTSAVKKSAETQKQVTGAALTEMQNKYKNYANQIIALQDKIAGREKSLAEQLRAMARTGMTDLGAWKDRKKEADEYAAAAEKAAEAGNFDEAVKLADQAKTAYAELNTEVKDGERVIISRQEALKTAMKGTEAAGKLSIEILKQQQAAIADNMDALTEKSGFQDLSKSMDGVKKKWLDNWSDMRLEAFSDIKKVEERLLRIKDKNVTVWINEKVKKATGGPVGFRAGGKLSGYGGGDKIHALLEAGEFIIRKEAVARFGAGLFSSLNNLQLPQLPAFATGGAVGQSETSSPLIRHEHNLRSQNGERSTVYTDDLNADKFIHMMQNALVGAA